MRIGYVSYVALGVHMRRAVDEVCCRLIVSRVCVLLTGRLYAVYSARTCAVLTSCGTPLLRTFTPIALAQALRTRDPDVLRLAQQNIAARRAGLRTPIGATPGSFETPGASILRGPFGGGMTTYLATPASTPVLRRGPVDGQRDPLGLTHPAGGAADGRDADGNDGPDGGVRLAPPMSLDRCALSYSYEVVLSQAAFFSSLCALSLVLKALVHEAMLIKRPYGCEQVPGEAHVGGQRELRGAAGGDEQAPPRCRGRPQSAARAGAAFLHDFHPALSRLKYASQCKPSQCRQ